MKAVVSLSGGRDSAVCLGLACQRYGSENVFAYGFEYGSKHPWELDHARQIAEYYGIPFKVITIDSSIFEGSTSTLLSSSGREVQKGMTYDEIMQQNGEHKVDTYVPARNTLFGAYVLAIAESLVQKYDEDVTIMLGQHADDSGFRVTEDGEEVLDETHAAYPDCSLSYVSAFAEVARISSVGRVHYETPFVKMHKWELIKLGMQLSKPVPFELCFSCYDPIIDENGVAHECGVCATDLDVQAAMEKAQAAIEAEKFDQATQNM